MNAIARALLQGSQGQTIGFGLLTVFILSTVAVLLSACVRRRAALRHTILLAGLIGCLLVPLLAFALATANWSLISLPFLPPEIQVRSSQMVAQELAHAELRGGSDFSARQSKPGIANSVATDLTHSLPPAAIDTTQSSVVAWESTVLFGWLAGTLVLAAFSVRSWRRVSKIRQSAWPLPGRSHASHLAELQLMKTDRGLPEVLLSDRVRTPVATGIFRPAILLPAAELDQVDDEELADILVHEAAHILRNDHFVLLVQALARCLFWPLPTIHWLNVQLDQAREEVCDNYVLAKRLPVNYGQTLLKIAQLACGEQPLPAAIGMVRRGALEARVAGLLDLRRDRAVTVSRLNVMLIASLFCLVGMALCGTRLVAQSEQQKSSDSQGSTIQTESPPGTPPDVETKKGTANNAAVETIVGTAKWNGKPISGLTVRAFRGATLIDQEFRSDENGQFRVPKVWRDAEGFLAVVAYNNNCIGWFDFFVHERADQGGQSPDSGDFTITLVGRDRRVRGRLVNEQQQPIAGIPVRINTLTHPANLLSTHWDNRMVRGERVFPEALTGQDGWFELHVPAETTASAVVVHSDWFNERVSIGKDVAELAPLKLVAAAKVGGRVIDGRTGLPVMGATVSVQAINARRGGAWGSAVTDREGRYTIGGLAAGTFNVLFDECPDKTLVAPAVAGVELKAGVTLAADFSLIKGRRLAGSVLDAATQKPVTNCMVYYYGPARPQSGGATMISRTNEKGVFEFHVPPGPTHIYIGDERATSNDSELDLEVAADRDPEPVILKAGPKTKEDRIRILVSNPVDRKVTIKAERMRLSEFLAMVCNHAGLELDLDQSGLKSVGITGNIAVTAEANQEALGPLLRRLFAPVRLDFVVIGRTLHVSSTEQIKKLSSTDN